MIFAVNQIRQVVGDSDMMRNVELDHPVRPRILDTDYNGAHDIVISCVPLGTGVLVPTNTIDHVLNNTLENVSRRLAYHATHP